MGKLKILIASETYPPDLNGAARFSEQLASSLAKNGHQVVVIAPSIGIKDSLEKKDGLKIFRMRSIPVKTIHPYFRAVVPLNINRKVQKIIDDFGPDIIHIQNHFILGKACFKAAKKNHIPIVGTGHFMPDNLLEYIPRRLNNRSSYFMWRDFVKVYNQLDCVTSPSYAAKNLVKKVGVKNKIFVISNGINLDKFKKKKSSPEDFAKFGLKKDVPIFIFVGRLEKDKNVDLILKASKLALAHTDFQVVIVGKGKDEKSFKNLAKELKLENKVFFTGPVGDQDLSKLLNIADVYIGSGSAELQGIAVMEGLAMSLPVLVLNAVALPELVEDGVNGFLFELDAKDLAKKMTKIIARPDKLKKMGLESHRLIQKHSQVEIIKKFEKLYKSTISKYKA